MIDMAIPSDRNVKWKEVEKKQKYKRTEHINSTNVEHETFCLTSSHWGPQEVTVKGHAVSGNNTRPALGTLRRQRLCWTQRLRCGAHLWFKEVETSWNVMTHRDARKGKWRGNWRMEWVASTFHTTSEHGVSSITTADAHTSAASSRLNWRPCRLKWTRPFRRKTKFGFCACAITFQTQSNYQ